VTATTTGGLRVLGSRDLPALSALLARDPIAHCFVSSRLEGSGMDAWRLGGEVWGWSEDGTLVSALYLGANLIPVETTAAARAAFADHAGRVGRRCSSIVGPAEEVLDLWALLEPAWGPAREVRGQQPLLAIEVAPRVRPDAAVRPLRSAELDAVLPACVAMFTEEVGVSPLAGGGAEPYRARVAEMLRRGRAFGRIEDGRVVFKAELGAVSADASQVQGVWVDPALRGRGLAAPALAAVVEQAYRLAPVVSLYVNDFNAPARAAYERVGFAAVGTFATVLF
jgi:predicted GNAT family acetyltransferase